MAPRQRIPSPLPPEGPWTDPLMEQARAVRDRFTEWIDGRRLRVAVCTGAAVLLIVPLAVWAVSHDGGDPDCPPPLELRLLTSPESQEAFADAAAVFETSGTNRLPLRAVRGGTGRQSPQGCRASRLTVYSATSDSVAEGFAHLDLWNAGEERAADDTRAPGGEAADGGAPESGSPGGGAAGSPTPGGGAADDQDGSDQDGSDQDGSDRGASHNGSGPDGDRNSADPDGDKTFQPLDGVGPQPDIWIPDSTAELDLVRQSLAPRGIVELSGKAKPVAYSPLVLGLPATLEPQFPAGSSETAAHTWDDLLTALGGLSSPPRLLRPGPTTSGAGLLHTVGRYLAGDGSLPSARDDVAAELERGRIRAMERELSTGGYPAEDSSVLLGALKDKAEANPGRGLDDVGVLISEKALVDFNESDERGTGPLPGAAPGSSGPCSDFQPVPRNQQLTAYYPKGVPALDHPFVRVSWMAAEADTARRAEAVERFRTWLTDDEGQAQLARAHYRPVGRGGPASRTGDGESALGCEGAGAEPAGPVYTADLPAPHIQQVLDAYEGARSPGRVLILFDVSPSMREGGKNREAERVVADALRVLGPNDTFGVWAYPGSDRDPAGHRVLVGLGAGRGAVPDAEETVRRAPLGVTTGAALYEVLGDAVETMRGRGDGDPEAGKRAILLVTDRGDDKVGGRDLDRVRRELLRKLLDPDEPRVPVLVADVHRPGCDPDLETIAQLSSGSSECLTTAQDVAKKLAGLLAVVENQASRGEAGAG